MGTFLIQQYTQANGWEFVQDFEFDNIQDTVEAIHCLANACQLNEDVFRIKLIQGLTRCYQVHYSYT